MSHRFKRPKPAGSRSALPLSEVSLPTPSPAIAGFTEYVAAQFNRTTLFLRNPLFSEIVAAIDTAYAAVRKENQHVTPGRARMYLTCHQAFFSAAACIARGVPLDAGAASRRALEAARTTLAIKLDGENAARWTAFEERMKRHRAREKGEKPPPLKIRHDVVDADDMGSKIGKFIGILSDGAVHFTPEFFSRLDFQQQNGGKMMFSEYLETDDQEIATHVKMLAAVHLLILVALDRCCEGGFSANPGFSIAVENIRAASSVLHDKYPTKIRPEFEKQLAETSPLEMSKEGATNMQD